MSVLTAVTRNSLLLQKAEGCGRDILVAIWCCGIISTSAFGFLHVFWSSVYSLRCTTYIHVHSLPHRVCVAPCTSREDVAPLCAELCLYMCTHRSECLLSPHGTLIDVAPGLILYSFGTPLWFLQTGIYAFLPLRGTEFNASSNSILHIKGQLFNSWKIGETLLYYSLSYWFVKLTQTHLHTSVTDYCELHIQDFSMI